MNPAADGAAHQQILQMASLFGETKVHAALRLGRADIALQKSKASPLLLLRHSRRGGTPLHLALALGMYVFFVEALSLLNAKLGKKWTFLYSTMLTEDSLEEWEEKYPTLIQKFSVDALFERWIRILSFKTEVTINSKGESLLYLAAERGSSVAVAALLDAYPLLSKSASGPNGWNALHAAVLGGHRDVADNLVNLRPELSRGLDKKGNSPLFFAVRSRQIRMIELLLLAETERSVAPAACMLNDDGMTPAHAAAIFGFLDVFLLLWRHCPISTLMCTSGGRNALHLSVEAGARDIFDFILASSDLQELLNERDENGNTPLHLAAIRGDAVMVEALAADSRINKQSVNSEGLTALDINQKLSTASTSQATNDPMAIETGVAITQALNNTELPVQLVKIVKDKTEEEIKFLDDIMGNLLLVDTLVITITFAAGFTIPGGYKSNGPNEGVAVLARKAALQASVVFDSLAFFISIGVAFAVIGSRSRDGKRAGLPRIVVEGLGRMLRLAFTFAALAFGTGVYATIAPESPWLAISVLVMACYLGPFIFSDMINIINRKIKIP